MSTAELKPRTRVSSRRWTPDQETLDWAMEILVRAMRDGGWTDINIKVKDGQIVHANRSDSLLPPAAGRTVQETGR